MTKEELVSIVAETRGLEITKKDTAQILTMAFELIQGALRKDRRFHLKEFGTFTVRTRKARKGVNPHTKEPMQISATRTVFFKPTPTFRRSL